MVVSCRRQIAEIVILALVLRGVVGIVTQSSTVRDVSRDHVKKQRLLSAPRTISSVIELPRHSFVGYAFANNCLDCLRWDAHFTIAANTLQQGRAPTRSPPEFLKINCSAMKDTSDEYLDLCDELHLAKLPCVVVVDNEVQRVETECNTLDYTRLVRWLLPVWSRNTTIATNGDNSIVQGIARNFSRVLAAEVIHTGSDNDLCASCPVTLGHLEKVCRQLGMPVVVDVQNNDAALKLQRSCPPCVSKVTCILDDEFFGEEASNQFEFGPLLSSQFSLTIDNSTNSRSVDDFVVRQCLGGKTTHPDSDLGSRRYDFPWPLKTCMSFQNDVLCSVTQALHCLRSGT